MTGKRWFWIAVLAGSALDLLSKSLVSRLLKPKLAYNIIPSFLAFRRTSNAGGVFGVMQGQGHVFIILSLVAAAMVVYFLWTSPPEQRFLHAALGAIMGGAIGNLVDRLVFGHVRDFIDVHLGSRFTWPTFNVADMFICAGSAVVVYYVLMTSGEQAPTEEGERKTAAN